MRKITDTGIAIYIRKANGLETVVDHDDPRTVTYISDTDEVAIATGETKEIRETLVLDKARLKMFDDTSRYEVTKEIANEKIF